MDTLISETVFKAVLMNISLDCASSVIILITHYYICDLLAYILPPACNLEKPQLMKTFQRIKESLPLSVFLTYKRRISWQNNCTVFQCRSRDEYSMTLNLVTKSPPRLTSVTQSDKRVMSNKKCQIENTISEEKYYS